MARLLRTEKAKWAAGISGAVWGLIFLILFSFTLRSSSNVNFLGGFEGVFLLGSLIGFVATALVLWGLFFLVDVILHAVSRTGD